MPMFLFSNDSDALLAAGLSSSLTSITLESGKGALFASPYGGGAALQPATLTHEAMPGVKEIVYITARADDVLTVLRGQEGSTSTEWPIGARLRATVTRGMLQNFLQGAAGMVMRDDCLAVGLNSSAWGVQAAALGPEATAAGDRSHALRGYAWTNDTLNMDMLPVLGRGPHSTTKPFTGAVGCEAVLVGHNVDLGEPPTWVAGATVSDHQILVPPSANGCQYLVVTNNAKWPGNHGVLDFTVTNAASTPYFNAAAESLTYNGTQSYLVAVAMPVVQALALPAGVDFYPTEVGFICETRGSGVSANPVVSIGTAAAPTLLASGVTLSGITGSGMRHRIKDDSWGMRLADLHARVDTAAVGGAFLGRFYFKGIFVHRL